MKMLSKTIIFRMHAMRRAYITNTLGSRSLLLGPPQTCFTLGDIRKQHESRTEFRKCRRATSCLVDVYKCLIDIDYNEYHSSRWQTVVLVYHMKNARESIFNITHCCNVRHKCLMIPIFSFTSVTLNIVNHGNVVLLLMLPVTFDKFDNILLPITICCMHASMPPKRTSRRLRGYPPESQERVKVGSADGEALPPWGALLPPGSTRVDYTYYNYVVPHLFPAFMQGMSI